MWGPVFSTCFNQSSKLNIDHLKKYFELLFFLVDEWHIDMVGLSLNQYRTLGNTSKINESIFPASDIYVFVFISFYLYYYYKFLNAFQNLNSVNTRTTETWDCTRKTELESFTNEGGLTSLKSYAPNKIPVFV